jgi:probable phosphoglycerate mutase
MRLFAARHGQTQWNVDNKICGVTDVPLTEEGWAQARALAEKTVDLELDLVICSSMLRAKQTASAVAEKLNIPVIEDPRLVEQNYGIYEGMDRKTPGFLENKRHFAVRYPGGESMMDVAHRIYGLLEDVKRDHAGKNVLLVCHGGVLRLVRSYFEPMTNEEYFHYSPGNADIREYEL